MKQPTKRNAHVPYNGDVQSCGTTHGGMSSSARIRANTFGGRSIVPERQKPPVAQTYPSGMPAKQRPSSKYMDGRASLGHQQNPKCEKIVMSDRAFAQVYSETKEKGSKETGGLLLGHRIDGVWYIVESSDPGYNGVFRHSYHESDAEYANHACTIISRIYKHKLSFLGMWHRHPGSMDSFSGTDDATNMEYAQYPRNTGNGCISLLVNKDPGFRLTAYYVDVPKVGIAYTKTDIEIGDKHIARLEVKEIASQYDIDRRK